MPCPARPPPLLGALPQSLLQAVGVGAKRSLPAAATINWVLKDGLGRLGRLTVATRFGESFDSDLKRFRYTTSVVYAAALRWAGPLAPSCHGAVEPWVGAGRLWEARRRGLEWGCKLPKGARAAPHLSAWPPHPPARSLEFLTPLFPQHFLLMASLANMGKSIGARVLRSLGRTGCGHASVSLMR